MAASGWAQIVAHSPATHPSDRGASLQDQRATAEPFHFVSCARARAQRTPFAINSLFR